jgi:extracellular elastinolytic metalloproteinase
MLDWSRATRKRGTIVLILGLLAALVLASIGTSPGASAAPSQVSATHDFQHEASGTLDLDNRAGAIAPSAAQQQTVAAMGAQATWTAFGTPASLARPAGVLASGLKGDAATAARAWLLANRGLFRLSEQDVAGLELLVDVPTGAGHTVSFRQRFDGMPAAADGLVSMAIAGGKLVYLSSSLAGNQGELPAATLTPQAAYRSAAANLGRQVAATDVQATGRSGPWTMLKVKGVETPQPTRLSALPTPSGVRPVQETLVMDGLNSAEPTAVRELVDAQSGEVLLREDLIDYESDPADASTQPSTDPRWAAFPASPRLDHSSQDTRELWCWQGTSHSCDRTLANDAARVPWDVDARTGASTNTSVGNAEKGVQNWDSANARTVGTVTSTARADRQYTYAWTNQWFNSTCDPANFTSPQANDIDAAITNLQAMHNRMHDFAYFLGFTEQTFNLQSFNFGDGGVENDPEQGNAQAGGRVGGPPGFAARDNANQITGPDGVAPITNMYLWQPVPGSFYSPCVDGDFDMSVIGHEYTHAISNRMVGGPDQGINTFQGGSMGESWSDLDATEYLLENGYIPVDGENPFAVGVYATGDKQVGIRDYSLDRNPLNYSDIGFDLTGPEVHADGEIWNGTNFDVRAAFNRRYDELFPSQNRHLQQACADGKLPADRCPGNRRWIQLVYDAFLLSQAGVTMVDARDAMLAADQMRFGGANQDLIWDAFAGRGLGEDASTVNGADTDPIADFSSPFSKEGTVMLRPVDDHGTAVSNATLFAGQFEARVTPVADTDAATPLGDSLQMVPGRYDFVVRAAGHGVQRVRADVRAGRTTTLRAELPTNLAASANGATASGDGINQGSLIDDTEGTNWAFLNGDIAGKQVTVRLDPSKSAQDIGRVQISALLRPRNQQDPGGDTETQSRFSALRQFQLLSCTVGDGVDCSQDSQFKLIYTSAKDAFPAGAPRPLVTDLNLRSFDIPNVKASFLRLRVLSNQCTGGPDFQGDQDNDPVNVTDCDEGSIQGTRVRVSELQVFSK